MIGPATIRSYRHLRRIPLVAIVCVAVLGSCGSPSGEQATATDPETKSVDNIESEITKEWVTTDRLIRRTCPSENCGVVGQLFFREAVSIHEKSDGWARITKYYDASCVDGHSEYVDSGNSDCVEQNGVKDGKFAEWVSASHLSGERPADPAVSAEGFEKLVASSDDYGIHKVAFVTAARQLIDDKTCTSADFVEHGGWIKSVTNYREQPVYFMYCGGLTISDRVYLDAQTGRVFR